MSVNILDSCFSQIGRFFGTIDPILMRNLVNESLFTSKKTFDYQSLCDPQKRSKAAAGLRSVYVVGYISRTHHTHKHTLYLPEHLGGSVYSNGISTNGVLQEGGPLRSVTTLT